MAQKAIGVVVGVIAGVAAFYVASKGVSGLFGSSIKAKHGLSASTPAGWQSFHSKEGFSIATPASYTQIDPRSPERLAAAQEVAKNNPGMKAIIDQATMSQDVRMFAVDPASIGSGFATNINIIKKTLPGGLVKTDKSLAEFRKGLEDTIPSSMHLEKCEFVELPVGEAVLSEVSMNLNGSTGPISAKSCIYMVPDDKDSYTITFACGAKDYDKLKATITQVAQSFRVD